jgi:hypothetical protein
VDTLHTVPELTGAPLSVVHTKRQVSHIPIVGGGCIMGVVGVVSIEWVYSEVSHIPVGGCI